MNVDPNTGELLEDPVPPWAQMALDRTPGFSLELTRRYIVLTVMHLRRLAMRHKTVKPLDLPERVKNALVNAATSSYGTTEVDMHSMLITKALRRLQIPVPDQQFSSFLSSASLMQNHAGEIVQIVRKEAEMLMAYVAMEADARKKAPVATDNSTTEEDYL